MESAETTLPASSFVMGAWIVWPNDALQPRGRAWSGKPIGALSAVITGAADLQCLEEKILEYTENLDEHVRVARQKLDAISPDWAGERAVQEALIGALLRLVK